MSASAIKIVIVDDHAIVRQGLRAMLDAEDDIEVTGEAGSVEEAIRRIRAFEEVGADCVYVPLPPTMEDLARICRSVMVPVNALVAGSFAGHSRRDFADIGVARLSLGSALARLTHRTLIDAAGSILRSSGSFSVLERGIAGSEVDRLLSAAGWADSGN